MWSSASSIAALPTPAWQASQAEGVNDNGDVSGFSSGRAVLWQNRGATDLGPGGAYDINNDGQVVGHDGTGAFLWDSGNGLRYLSDLIPPEQRYDPLTGTGWQLKGAIAINDRGQIIGWGYLNGVNHAFLLTPVQ